MSLQAFPPRRILKKQIGRSPDLRLKHFTDPSHVKLHSGKLQQNLTLTVAWPVLDFHQLPF